MGIGLGEAAAVSVEVGVPFWTSGKFKSISAENDLGLENVGAFLLRRLLPGIVEATPQAGYFALYAYLLAKHEERSDSARRADFVPFFRRQELAYAIACRLHAHGVTPVPGIQGWYGAGAAIRESDDAIDLSAYLDRYSDAPLGGYARFYARMLEALRLTRPGAYQMVDRVTERGQSLAHAFARTFEDTRYYREFFEADVVPVDVLRDLGNHVCLCTIPGRSDHQTLLDVFVGEPEQELAWESLRQRRVRSFALHLTYHRDRPDEQPGDVDAFRATIASGRFSDGSPLSTSFTEIENSWTAYQLRESQTLALTALWSWYLQRLQETYPTTHLEVRDGLCAETDWQASAALDGSETLTEARARAEEQLPDGRAIVEAVAAFTQTPNGQFGGWLATSLLALLAIDREASREESGLSELRNDGGSARWSLAHMHDWLAAREQQTLAETQCDLIDELRIQHLRIATPKLSPTDQRDPFCFAEDNGVMRFIRGDDPFWTSGRFGVLNTLLCSLGLLEAPTGEARLTPLGAQVLAKVTAGA